MSQRKSKRQRWYIKRQKRLIKLMYKKGLLNDYPLNSLRWVDHRIPYLGKCVYCFGDTYIPITGDIISELKYDHLPEYLPDSFDCQYDDMREFSTFHSETYSILIKSLKGLPTLRSDSKINKILIFGRN